VREWIASMTNYFMAHGMTDAAGARHPRYLRLRQDRQAAGADRGLRRHLCGGRNRVGAGRHCSSADWQTEEYDSKRRGIRAERC
jgi:hypothetical protein